MKSAILIIASAFGVLGSVGPVVAEQPAAFSAEASSPDDSSGAVRRQPEVTINGNRAELTPRISAFVDQVTDFDPADPGLGLARWQVPVCPLVTGLPAQEGEFILGRVSEIARNAEVPLAAEHCTPNLYVFVSSEPEALLRALERRNRPFTFADAPPSLIDAFVDAARPVRVWYHTVQRTPEGMPLLSMSIPELDHQGDKALALQGSAQTLVPPGLSAPGSSQVLNSTGVPHSFGTNPWSQSSRLIMNAVWAIYRVFVIVDQRQLHSVSRGQLADYVAMVGLSEIKPGARLGDAQTILTLFQGPPHAAHAGLTDWDQAFLKSLYATDQKSKLQRSAIASNMVRSIVPR